MIARNLKWMAIVAAMMVPVAISGTAQTAKQPMLPVLFDVVDTDHGDRFVARIRIDGAGRIAAERIDPERRDWVETIVREMNQQETIIVPAPPPSSAPRFAMYGVPVARDDPEFLAAMEAYLRRFHALALR
jgi:hypothetical protein